MSEENKDLIINEGEGVKDPTEKNTESGESSESNESNGKESKKSESDKVFTQEQLNKMMTREKNQGRNSVYRELGIDPKDTKAIAMIKALIDSQKTDEQKANEESSEAQAKMSEAEQRAQLAEAKAEAMLLGVKTQYVEDIVTLSLAKMTDDADLKTIIGEFKIKYPDWFGISKGDSEEVIKEKNQAGQKGTGSTINVSKGDAGTKEKSLGARLAAQRKGSSKKSSYWGKN